jgi:hypothetical protein
MRIVETGHALSKATLVGVFWTEGRGPVAYIPLQGIEKLRSSPILKMLKNVCKVKVKKAILAILIILLHLKKSRSALEYLKTKAYIYKIKS